MFIVLKKQSGNSDEVLNMFYGETETGVAIFIKEYINEDIEKLKLQPNLSTEKYVEYEIENNKNITNLIKSYKKIHKGYIYNSSERIKETLYTLEVLEYDCNKSLPTNIPSNNLWLNLNDEINNRVLKQLDKESLYQIFVKIQAAIKTKQDWNKVEYINLINEVIKNFKKNYIAQ